MKTKLNIKGIDFEINKDKTLFIEVCKGQRFLIEDFDFLQNRLYEMLEMDEEDSDQVDVEDVDGFLFIVNKDRNMWSIKDVPVTRFDVFKLQLFLEARGE